MILLRLSHKFAVNIGAINAKCESLAQLLKTKGYDLGAWHCLAKLYSQLFQITKSNAYYKYSKDESGTLYCFERG